MSLSPGSRLGAYQITGQLGAGGMGEVYRAHDGRLGRDVALKVLHADVARDPVRLERFTREARAVAALNHPHIVTIYSIEDVDGVPFMTMEIVEGQTLDLAIASGLAVRRFLELAVPIADALTAAHQKQITHRDLKPGNVMVTADGRVKVLDFGLARVGDAATPEETLAPTRAALTHQGTIVGTMPYMSPEQVEGRPLDARTDLFSLGVMLYEMLAGSRPFAGGSSPALMSAILRDMPKPLDDVRADLPDSLVRLIGRCLEKRPEDRIQTARDVYNELRHVQKQIESGTRVRSDSASAMAAEASLWIVVLPFAVRGSDPDAGALASGLTEDITSGLSRFPALSVIAGQSARAFRDSALDVRQIAERLGARYVLGGTVRKSSSVRVAAHLVDARSGANLWSETYDRPLESHDLFTIQDDLTDHIVATVADKSGVLARSMVQAARHLPLAQLSARELILHCWMFQWNPQPAMHVEIRAALEARLDVERENPHLWAELANIYICEHSLFANPLPDPLGRSMRAARRALEIDPGHQEGWEMVALSAFYLKDDALFREAADRAIRLNPRNSNALAWMGNLRVHAGDYDAGCELTARAMALNPSHPGWYHFAPFSRHFARGEFEEALKAARRVNMPEFMWMQFAIAAAAGHLGLQAEAKAAADRMVALAPAIADDGPLAEFVRRWYWPPDLAESLLDGVRKARGGAASAAGNRLPSSLGSQAVRTGSRRLAVLAFSAPADDADLRILGDGLTEDVTAGLSRFGYLSVVPVHDTRQTDARYRLDGRLRRIGTALRATVRVMDAASGTQLWSETYNRDATSGVSLQDDLTDRIVATVGDSHGVLMRAMSQGTEHLAIDALDTSDLELRYWAYHRQHAPAEHGLLRDAFEGCVEERPGYAFGWAALAHLYCHEHGFMFNARPDPLGRARRAIARASELDPVDQHGWEALALAYFFERDPEGFSHASERAIALNTRNANTLAWMGVLTTHTGELDRGCALALRATTLNPDHPGWYHIAGCNAHLVRGEYAEALRAAKRVNMPQHIWQHVLVAIAAAELGRAAEAAAGVNAVEALVPPMVDPDVVADATGRWKWDAGIVEQMMRGYRKALVLRGQQPPSPGLTQSGRSGPPEADGPASSPGGFAPVTASELNLSVVVRPFTAPSGDEAMVLASGLTEDIVTGLSRFGNLKVVLGRNARYALEGSVRQSGSTVRVTARVVDSTTGANIWSDGYDRALSTGVFALQDDVGSRIVSTVADPTGVLATAMAAAIGDRAYDTLSVQELVIRFHLYTAQLRPAEHARLRDALERALEREPEEAEGWACLAHLYGQEHALRLNPNSGSRERERRAAERAVELAPQSPWAWTALARSHMFAHDGTAMRAAVDRALALNPLNADMLAHCSIFLSCCGDFDRAEAVVTRAMQLKPHHQGWFYFPIFNVGYLRGDDEAALDAAKKINMPALPLASLAGAAAAGQLGRIDEARVSLDALRQHAPQLLDAEAARTEWSAWLWSDALLDRLVAGLEKALTLTNVPRSDAASLRRSPVNAVAATDMRVAVLPFTARGGENAALLASGLTEDIATALARFASVTVVSRAQSDANTARFTLEGSVTVSSETARVGVRLVDARSAGHVWAESYDRALTSELFVVQDDVTGRIAATVADSHGVVVRTLLSTVRDVPLAELDVRGLVVRYEASAEQLTAAVHAELREAFEQAVAREPNAAEAWACLAMLYSQEIFFGFNSSPESQRRLRHAATCTVTLNPDVQRGWIAMAAVALFDRDRAGLEAAIDRGLRLNPLHTRSLATLGLFTAFAGDPDSGAARVERSIDLNPRHPGWYFLAPFLRAYTGGQYPDALGYATRIAMPNFVAGHLAAAAAAGQTGTVADARPALEALARFDASLVAPEGARVVWARWIWDDSTVEALVDGLRKARAMVSDPAVP